MIIFDLDGTLIDSSKGIESSIKFALRQVGLTKEIPQDLSWCIGPPIRESLKHILDDVKTQSLAVDFYYSHFQKYNILNYSVYEGVDLMLAQVSASNSIRIATSKNEVHAKQILEHANLSHFFSGIHGAKPRGVDASKSKILSFAINHADPNDTYNIMVGDRAHDISAAKNIGIDSVGVTYGFGTTDELTDAGSTMLCESPSDLPNLLDNLKSRRFL